MSTDHNRIKVADLEKNQPNKILKTNQNGELEFSDATIQVENYNALDYTTEGKALDARQGKVLKEMIDNIKSPNNLSTTEVLNLVKDNKLIPGDYYLINDFQTIYTINGSDSTPPTYPRLITSYVSGYATLDAGYDYVLIVGKQVKITKLPTGYSGSLQIGQTTTISEVASNYYFKFANGMQNLMGLEFSYTTPRYSNGIPDNLVVNDSNGKPVIRPGGVLNIEVHNNTPYMNMTATENLGVPMESIMLKAKSTNEFELEGKSVTYTDDVIEYQLPTDGDIAVKGKILRRYNNALNIDIRDDWRVKRYRRWKIDSASILKVLNQDQAVTSLTGFNGVYQFTATKSSSATPDRFYIASDLDSKSITLDEFTRVTNFTLATLSYTSAKDYPIFSLDSSHNPVNVSRMKVSGYFGNTVIQRNLGELNFSTNIDVEVLSNSTFVCSFVSEGKFIKIYDSLFLDTLQIAAYSTAMMMISSSKFLSNVLIGNPNMLFFTNSIIAVNTNNYSGAPFPNVRWIWIELATNTEIENSLIGGSQTNFRFKNSHLLDSTLFVYNSMSGESNSGIFQHKLIFDNCFMKYMSIFNRAKLSSTIFDSIISNPEYIPANTQKRNLYVNSTDLSQIKIKFNKYSRKLYYEYRDASDALVINTYSLPS